MKQFFRTIFVTVTACACFPFCGCGLKEYNEPLSCEDRELEPLSSFEESELDSETKEALEAYRSLEGTWRAKFACVDKDAVEAEITISELMDSNVELYSDEQPLDCDVLGIGAFEARFSNTDDIDLDGVSFFFTARLEKGDGGPSDFILEAESDDFSSRIPEHLSFKLELTVDFEQRMEGAKIVAFAPVEGSSSKQIQTQGTYCTIGEAGSKP